jgi:hypothetical protein
LEETTTHRPSDKLPPSDKYGLGVKRPDTTAKFPRSTENRTRQRYDLRQARLRRVTVRRSPQSLYSADLGRSEPRWRRAHRPRGFSETFCAAASCHAACRGMRGIHHRTITPCVLWCCTIARHAAGSTPRLRVESGHWPEDGLCISGRGSGVVALEPSPPARVARCLDEAPYADGEASRNSVGECAARHSHVPRRPG